MEELWEELVDELGLVVRWKLMIEAILSDDIVVLSIRLVHVILQAQIDLMWHIDVTACWHRLLDSEGPLCNFEVSAADEATEAALDFQDLQDRKLKSREDNEPEKF